MRLIVPLRPGYIAVFHFFDCTEQDAVNRILNTQLSRDAVLDLYGLIAVYVYFRGGTDKAACCQYVVIEAVAEQDRTKCLSAQAAKYDIARHHRLHQPGELFKDCVTGEVAVFAVDLREGRDVEDDDGKAALLFMRLT